MLEMVSLGLVSRGPPSSHVDRNCPQFCPHAQELPSHTHQCCTYQVDHPPGKEIYDLRFNGYWEVVSVTAGNHD